MENDSVGVVLMAVVIVSVLLLLVLKLVQFINGFRRRKRYLLIEMNRAGNDDEYRFWHRELRCHYLYLIPFVTERNVMRVYRLFFHESKHAAKEKRSDGLMHILAPSMLAICICAICLCGASWAWFTASTSTGTTAIRSSSYKLLYQAEGDTAPIELSGTKTVKALVQAGIPVCGHLGLTPQSVHVFGGFGLRAKEDAEAQQLIKDAKALQEAGCFAIVLEKIPAKLTEQVCAELTIPVIGIGAGTADGQVLVLQDMLGMNDGFHPKFLRQYANIGQQISEAVAHYADDVRQGNFPSEKESY